MTVITAPLSFKTTLKGVVPRFAISVSTSAGVTPRGSNLKLRPLRKYQKQLIILFFINNYKNMMMASQLDILFLSIRKVL